MKDLSLVQEYMICAVNEKGGIPSFSTEKLVCLVAAGLLDLRLAGCLAIEGKKVQTTSPLPEDRAYLASLYEFVGTSPRPWRRSWRPIPTPSPTSGWSN